MYWLLFRSRFGLPCAVDLYSLACCVLWFEVSVGWVLVFTAGFVLVWGWYNIHLTGLVCLVWSCLRSRSFWLVLVARCCRFVATLGVVVGGDFAVAVCWCCGGGCGLL